MPYKTCLQCDHFPGHLLTHRQQDVVADRHIRNPNRGSLFCAYFNILTKQPHCVHIVTDQLNLNKIGRLLQSIMHDMGSA